MRFEAMLLTALMFAPAIVTAAPAMAGASTADPVDQMAQASGVPADAADERLAELEPGPLSVELVEMYALMGEGPTHQALELTQRSVEGLPAELHEPTALMLAAMNEATRMHAKATAGVTAEEVRFARSLGTATDLTPTEQARLTAIASKVDESTIAQAGQLLAAAAEEVKPEYKQASDHEGMVWEDPLNVVRISGSHDEVHREDHTFQVDLGGDDWWANNAGAVDPQPVIQAFPGCITTGGPDCTPLHPSRNGDALKAVFGQRCSFNAVAPVFDTRDLVADGIAAGQQGADAASEYAGNAPDRAQAAAEATDPNTGCTPQGADDAQPWADAFVNDGTPSDGDEHFVSVGIDLAGNDRVAPPKGFNAINNGGNVAGCDTTDMGEDGKIWVRNMTAGSAFFGHGLFVDDSGNDFYGGRSITQGTAHIFATGTLIDRGGDDHYVGVRFAQGTGFVEAYGYLIDGAGNDNYELKNDVPLFNEFEHFVGCDVSTRDGMGRANFHAVGAMIDDGEGNDRYYVQDHDDAVPGASRDDPKTTMGSTGVRIVLGPEETSGFLGVGRGLLLDDGGQDEYIRSDNMRGNSCQDADGSFFDLGATPTQSLQPC